MGSSASKKPSTAGAVLLRGDPAATEVLMVQQGLWGAVLYKTAMDFFDDGPEKPVRSWSRIGRRPILSVGNSNGDLPMLAFSGTPHGPALRLLLLHDDASREFDYVAGAEDALQVAAERDWTVISLKSDWTRVFADTDT